MVEAELNTRINEEKYLPYIAQRTRRRILLLLYGHPDYVKNIAAQIKTGEYSRISRDAVALHVKEMVRYGLIEEIDSTDFRGKTPKFQLYCITDFGRYLLEKFGFAKHYGGHYE